MKKRPDYIFTILGLFCGISMLVYLSIAQETDTSFDVYGSKTQIRKGMIGTYQGGGQVEKAEWMGFLDKISPDKKGDPNDVSWKRTLFKECVANRLIYEEALDAKLDKTPEFINYYKYMEGLSEISEEGLLIDALFTKEVREKAVCTKSEMKEYYEGHKEEFATPETISIRDIFVDNTKTRKTAIEKRSCGLAEALEKIKEAYAQLQKGEAFVSVAKKYSESEPDRRGEIHGPYTSKMILKEIEDAAPALKPGHFSGIITTQHEYIIVYLEEHKPAGFQPFEEVKVNIKNILETQKLSGLVQNIMKRAMENMEITKHYNYLSDSTAKAGRILIDMPGLNLTLGDFRTLERQYPRTEDSFPVDNPTVDQEKQYLDRMVRDQTLVLLAKELKLDREPSVINQLADFKKNQLVEFWLNRRIEERLKVTQKDLQNYYDKNTAQFMFSIGKEKNSFPTQHDNEIRDSRLKTFEEVKEDIRYFVEQEMRGKLRQEILDEKLRSVGFQYDSSRL